MQIVNLELLLQNLRELSDRSRQESLWLGREPGKTSSFVEAGCGAFDDSALSDIMDSERFEVIFGHEAAAALRELDAALAPVDADLAAETLIELPQMEKVRQSAARAIDAIRDERDAIDARNNSEPSQTNSEEQNP